MKKCLVPSLLILFIIANVHGQVLQQVADINPIGSAYPWQLTVCNNKLFFIASPQGGNRSLYVTEGSAATTVELTTPRQISSAISPVSYKNKLYFSYDDGVNGQELWVSDGTPAGTKLFADLYAGSASGYPVALTVANNKLFFIANNQNGDRRLFASDGTTAGTTVIRNDFNDYFNGGSNGLVVYNNNVLFISSNSSFVKGLWKSDGTTTVPIKEGVVPGVTGPWATELNGKLYLCMNDDNYGNELWVTDGTNGGTHLVKDISTGDGANGNPQSFITYNNKVYFSATDGINGQELWSTDGTEAGTAMVKDVVPGATGSLPYQNFVYNNKLYFAAWGLSELWVSDGTEAGTQKVAAVQGSVKFAANFNNTMYLITGSNGQIYQSDGTTAGTKPLKVDNSINPISRDYQSGADQYFLQYNNELYFQANCAGITTGYELSKLSAAVVSFNWTGVTSSDWNTASNWSGQVVPTATSDVTIPAGTVFSLVITGTQQVSCKSLHISPNALVTVNSGGNIKVVN